MKNTKIISTEPEPCFTAVITEFILFRPTCLYSEFIIYHFTHETDPRNIVINYFFSTLIRFRSLMLSNCCCSCNTWNKIAYVCTVQLLNINWQKNITQNYLHAKQHNTAKIPRNGDTNRTTTKLQCTRRNTYDVWKPPPPPLPPRSTTHNINTKNTK